MPTQTGSIDLKAAKAAADIAKETSQYFWFNSQDSGAGEGAGAHITEVDSDTFISDPSNGGGNVLINSNSINIRDGATNLATFGVRGAQIGAEDDSANIFISPDGVSSIGSDGAPYFDFSATGAQISYEVKRNLTGGTAHNKSIGTSITEVLKTTSDLSSLSAGTSCMVYHPRLFLTINTLWYTGVTNVSNCASRGSGHTASIFYIGNTSITIGTNKSSSATARFYWSQTSGGSNYLNILVNYNFVYDASTGKVTITIKFTSSKAVTINAIALSSGYYIYSKTADAPCMTFGTRSDDETAGALSSTFGKSLYGSSDYQTVLGKYNSQDNADTYALIIGKGSADDDRSNALTVDWYGNVNIPTGKAYKVGGVSLVDLIYPVGSIYMSVSSTSPATLFGGTWQQIEDTFLLAAGNTYAAGATGGEATHTLIESELPNITGTFYERRINASASNHMGSAPSGAFSRSDGDAARTVAWASSSTSIAQDQINMSFGSGIAHNNMPPYLAVYVWKRTA